MVKININYKGPTEDGFSGCFVEKRSKREYIIKTMLISDDERIRINHDTNCVYLGSKEPIDFTDLHEKVSKNLSKYKHLSENAEDNLSKSFVEHISGLTDDTDTDVVDGPQELSVPNKSSTLELYESFMGEFEKRLIRVKTNILGDPDIYIYDDGSMEWLKGCTEVNFCITEDFSCAASVNGKSLSKQEMGSLIRNISKPDSVAGKVISENIKLASSYHQLRNLPFLEKGWGSFLLLKNGCYESRDKLVNEIRRELFNLGKASSIYTSMYLGNDDLLNRDIMKYSLIRKGSGAAAMVMFLLTVPVLIISIFGGKAIVADLVKRGVAKFAFLTIVLPALAMLIIAGVILGSISMIFEPKLERAHYFKYGIRMPGYKSYFEEIEIGLDGLIRKVIPHNSSSSGESHPGVLVSKLKSCSMCKVGNKGFSPNDVFALNPPAFDNPDVYLDGKFNLVRGGSVCQYNAKDDPCFRFFLLRVIDMAPGVSQDDGEKLAEIMYKKCVLEAKSKGVSFGETNIFRDVCNKFASYADISRRYALDVVEGLTFKLCADGSTYAVNPDPGDCNVAKAWVRASIMCSFEAKMQLLERDDLIQLIFQGMRKSVDVSSLHKSELVADLSKLGKDEFILKYNLEDNSRESDQFLSI